MVLKKRWDRMEIPLPFARIGLVFGVPIKVPSEISAGQVQVSKWSGKLAKAITRLDRKAENMVYNNGTKKGN